MWRGFQQKWMLLRGVEICDARFSTNALRKPRVKFALYFTERVKTQNIGGNFCTIPKLASQLSLGGLNNMVLGTLRCCMGVCQIV